MKVHFKHAKLLVNGKLYAKGEHQLPDAMADHWYIKALIKDGDLAIIEEPSKAAASPSGELPVSSEEESSVPEKADDESSEQQQAQPRQQKQGKRSNR